MSGKIDREGIQSLGVNPINPELLAVGTNAGSLSIWKVDPNQESTLVSFSKGRKKLKTTGIDFKPMKMKKDAHFDSITSIEWISADRFATGSLDHSFRIFECERLTETFHVNLKDFSATSLAYSGKTGQFLVGHEDGYIRQFDERAQSRQATKLFKSHSKWVSDIAFHPVNDYNFASVIKI
jgi:WD domain, G-beta repeat